MFTIARIQPAPGNRSRAFWFGRRSAFTGAFTLPPAHCRQTRPQGSPSEPLRAFSGESLRRTWSGVDTGSREENASNKEV